MPPFLIPFVGPLFDKLVGLIPDKAAAAKARADAELALGQQNEDLVKAFLASDTAQDAINQAAANSSDKFDSRPRPFIIWVCGVAFAWTYVLEPILVFLLAVFHRTISAPLPDMSALMPVLMALLGMSGLHAYQQVQNSNGGK